MRRNFLPLISFLIEEMAKNTMNGAMATAAFESVADHEGLGYLGKLDDGSVNNKAGFSTAATSTKEIVDMGFYEPQVISCGVSANALCYIFLKRRQPANVCTMEQLRTAVKDGRQRLIRIDLYGHSYVIEQVEGKVPKGNVYQSNMAVIGNSVLGITLHKYLREHENPVTILPYLDDLVTLTSSATDKDTRAKLYCKLYTTRSYLANKEVVPITPESASTATAKRSLRLHRLSYQPFAEKDVLSGVYTMFMAYAYHLQKAGNKNPFADAAAKKLLWCANQARDIYYTRCGV